VKHALLSLTLLLSACAYQTPTAPTFVEPAPRTTAQLAIYVAGPDNWWSDRLIFSVTAYDQNGAELNTVVTCQSSDGVVEPANFATLSNKAALLRGVRAGSVVTCNYRDVTTQYLITALDWRVRCCGTAPAPTPRPPVVPVPDKDN